MSQVGDALSGGGSSASGISDTTLSDASLGDQIMGGSGDFGTGDASAFSDAGGGGNSFSSFNDIANAFSGGSAGGGGTPTAVQSASMTPPAAAGQTGGDPTGAAGGTQSSTTPGSTPTDQSQQQGGGKQQTDPNYAPPQAVSQLKALLKQLNTGKPPGPTGPTPQGGQAAPFALPTLAAGQTGPQSAFRQLVSSQPAAASLEGGPPGMGPGPAGTEPGGDKDIRTALPTGGTDDFDPATGKWAGRTAAGTPADLTPLPPPRPKDLGAQPAVGAGQGRGITVRPKGGAGAGPATVTTPPGTADKSVPTKKPAAAPAPTPVPTPAAQGPATGSIIRDISGVSTGSPTALADLAQAAKVIAPLIPLFAGLFGGGRGGRFHGGRFTHGFGGGLSGFRGGMNAMGLHGGRHPMAPGAWPYHHPQMGWHMHPRHPGPGWLPLNPMDAQGIVGGGGQQQGQDGQDPNAPDPNRPPKETGADALPPDQVGTSGAIPGVSAKDVDAYTRQAASKWGIDPETASRVLAQESSYGQARQPGDNGTSFGPFQLHFAPDGRAMGDQFQRDTGLDPRDPSTWKAQIDYAMKQAAQGGWGPWTTTMHKLGMGQWSGITTNKQFAGQPRTNQQPKWASTNQPAWANNPIPETLPVTSQPMVAGP